MWMYVTGIIGAAVLSGVVWSMFLRIVVLGDSLATGVGSYTFTSYVPRLVWWMIWRLKRPVKTSNFGKFGWTSAQLLTALREDQRMRRAVSRAHLISLDIGGNDLRSCFYQKECLEEKIGEYAANWQAVLKEIRLLNPNALLFTMTLFNPVPLGDIRRPPVELYISRANQVVMNASLLSEYQIAGIGDVHHAFIGHECQYTWYCRLGDIHPTDAGHAAIATAMASAIEPYLTGKGPAGTKPRSLRWPSWRWW